MSNALDLEQVPFIFRPDPKLIGQSYQEAIRSSVNAAGDASFVVLATIVVPAGAMNKNAKLVCVTDWAYTNSASVKTLSMDWDGQNISGVQATTSSSMKILIEIQNKNSLTSQTIHNSNTYGSAARVSKAANTAGNINIDLKCMWSAAALSETITLLGYSFWCYPGTV